MMSSVITKNNWEEILVDVDMGGCIRNSHTVFYYSNDFWRDCEPTVGFDEEKIYAIPPIPWLSNEPLDDTLIIEQMKGYPTRLMFVQVKPEYGDQRTFEISTETPFYDSSTEGNIVLPFVILKVIVEEKPEPLLLSDMKLSYILKNVDGDDIIDGNEIETTLLEFCNSANFNLLQNEKEKFYNNILGTTDIVFVN
jgi:hypothetical protein